VLKRQPVSAENVEFFFFTLIDRSAMFQTRGRIAEDQAISRTDRASPSRYNPLCILLAV